jgi:hypothetical protein
MPGQGNTVVLSRVQPASSGVGVINNASAVINDSTQAAITAHAGGGQANAVPITARYAEISVCATLHDSVILPKALPGMSVSIANAGAAGADVYPATGEKINNGAANAIFALSNGKNAMFFCVAAGNWYAVLTA